MAAVLMSNPLHLAVLGNPPRRSKRHVSKKPAKKKGATPMAKKRSSYKKRSKSTKRKAARKVARKTVRKNPAIAKTGKAYVSGLAGTPAKVMGLFKGKSAVKNTVFAAGGAVATYVAGGMVSKALGGVIAKIPGAASPVGARLIGGLMPYTIAFAGSRFIKDANLKKAVMVGGGVASLVEVIMPGKVAELISRIPGVASLPMPAQAAVEAGPVEGLGRTMLAGYVDAPAYAGAGAYVDSPAYAGTGAYVDSPAYAGTGGLGEDMLAGMGEEALAGNYLEDSTMFEPAF